jgi:Ca-activated chloride channel family protein
MSFRLLRFALITTLGFAFATQQAARPGPGSAAQSKPPASQLPRRVSDQTYRVNVDLVNMLCSVWNKNTNAFVTNLVKEDFTILEDDQKQEIRNFVRETNLPLTIALLVDTSSSVAPKLKFEQDAAISFFHNVLREQDRAMLLAFDSGVSMVQDFTNDPNKLAKGIRSLKAAGGTALYDAIYHVCDEKLIRETGRKAIVILSDGDDTSSKMAFAPALEMALRAETIIFAISTSRGGYFGVSSDTPGDKLLKRLAEDTGGQAIYPFKTEELEDSFRQINQELRSQYSLGYLSRNEKRDGTYRKVEIKVAEKGLRLNYRRGYYAPTS